MTDSINVDIHPAAAEEIEAAEDWYFDVDPNVAANFRKTVFAALKRIGDQPRTFPIVEVGLRRCTLRGFPYVILFDDSTERILVIAVAHTRRRPGYWKRRSRKPT